MIEQIILIAVIQGLTEFLPISSSGHLNLLHGFTGYTDQGLAMDVAVHIGTVFAVIIYNWHKVKNMIIGFLSFGRYQGEMFTFAMMTIIATIPVVIVGYWLNDNPELIALTRSIEIIAWMTIIFGIILGIADRRRGQRRLPSIKSFDAIVIGLAQVIALIPGVSRAGITMTAGRALGLTRHAAAQFSMIMSIPVILGSGLLKGKDIIETQQFDLIYPMFLAAVIAMVVALVSIGVMMAIINRIGFMPFVIYRIVIGVVLLTIVYF